MCIAGHRGGQAKRRLYVYSFHSKFQIGDGRTTTTINAMATEIDGSRLIRKGEKKKHELFAISLQITRPREFVLFFLVYLCYFSIEVVRRGQNEREEVW